MYALADVALRARTVVGMNPRQTREQLQMRMRQSTDRCRPGTCPWHAAHPSVALDRDRTSEVQRSFVALRLVSAWSALRTVSDAKPQPLRRRIGRPQR